MDEKYKSIGSPAIRLIEECSEVIKAVSKAERFGYDDINPCHSLPKTNFDDIRDEIIDVLDAWDDLKKLIKR